MAARPAPHTHGAVRGASRVVAQRILRGDEVVVTADVRVAAIAGGRPSRIPDGLRAILSAPDLASGTG
jgi:acyl-CoA thioesterase FadM